MDVTGLRPFMRPTAWLALALFPTTLLAGCSEVPSEELPGNATSAPTTPTSSPPTTTLPPIDVVRVHYVSVGQGDGTIWELPDGTILIYDCGPAAPDPDSNPMTVYLRDNLSKPFGSSLWALVSSHGHLDHIGGCEELFDSYNFTHIYETWYTQSDAPNSYKTFKTQVKAEGATIHTLGVPAGLSGAVPFQQWDLVVLPQAATDAGVQVQIGWPTGSQTTSWSKIAEKSIALRLAFGQSSFCLQGDIETAQENALVADIHAYGCTVYLMGHHGSRYASSPSWLQKMSPQFAPVSFGTNSYGHPTPDALCRVQTAGADVYATHRLGAIVFASDGTDVTVLPNQPESQDYCAPGASYW